MILINFEYMIFYSPHKWRTWTRQVFHQLLLGQCRHSLRLGFFVPPGSILGAVPELDLNDY